MQTANMLSLGTTIVETVARHVKELHGWTIEEYPCNVTYRNDSLIVQYRGRDVLTIHDYAQRKGINGSNEVTFRATFATYVGWKLYMRLTGCFASLTKGDAQLAKGIDAPIETVH